MISSSFQPQIHSVRWICLFRRIFKFPHFIMKADCIFCVSCLNFAERLQDCTSHCPSHPFTCSTLKSVAASEHTHELCRAFDKIQGIHSCLRDCLHVHRAAAAACKEYTDACFGVLVWESSDDEPSTQSSRLPSSAASQQVGGSPCDDHRPGCCYERYRLGHLGQASHEVCRSMPAVFDAPHPSLCLCLCVQGAKGSGAHPSRGEH